MTTSGSSIVSHSGHQAEVSRGHLARIYELLHALGGRTSAGATIEEDNFRIREGYQDYRLDAAEPELALRDLGHQPAVSPLTLTYFARSMHLTQLIGHIYSDGAEIPVHYSITGAIILRRENRRFKIWGEPKLQNSVLLPWAFVKDRNVFERFRGQDFEIIDTGADRAEYTQLRISAVRRALELTRELRGGLYARWKASDGGDPNKWMMLHGNIFDVPNSELSSNVVAIGEQFYAPWQNSQLLEPALGTGLYHRSRVLRVSKPDDAGLTKYLWYTRLRRTKQAVPEFGLLRCMALASDERQVGELVDKVSTQLLGERIPVTFPEPEWDRLPFPIKLCGDYLESMIPSRETIRSFFARD